MSEEKYLPKKELILKAASKIFADKGFYDARIDEIAKEAGVGKGTVYEYFKSKGELFYQVHQEYISSYCQLIEQEISTENTTRGKILALVRKTLMIGCHMVPNSVMGTYIKDERFIRWIRGMLTQHIKSIENVVRVGIEKGEIRPVNEQLFCRVLLGGTSFLMGPIGRIEYKEEDVDRIAEEIVEYYLKGIEINQ